MYAYTISDICVKEFTLGLLQLCFSLVAFEHSGNLEIVILQDNGDSFFYTGSGGRDLSGNKRTAEQSCDQQLTRMNR